MPGFGLGHGFGQFGPAILRGFRPELLFANGEKGVLLLPENSNVAVGSPVASVTDTSGNGKHATQASASKRPILRQDAATGALYWEFDGVDDCLQCAALGLNTVDAVTVFTAVRKTSDAAAGTIAELSNNTGNFSLFGPSSAAGNYGWRTRGSAAPAVLTATPFAAPHTAVITGTGKISTDTMIIRVNGAQANSSALDQGSGNFGNFGLFIGQRDGSSLPFAGRIYGAIVLGREPVANDYGTETMFKGRSAAF